MSSAPPKRSRFSENSEDVSTPTPSGVGALSAARIKEMMANAQKQIEERKKQLEQLHRQQAKVPLPVPTVIPTVVPTVIPTVVPTVVPTIGPSKVPTVVPTIVPKIVPTPVATVTSGLLNTDHKSNVDSKTRIAELTAQIQARLANRNLVSSDTPAQGNEKGDKPTPLILNSEGRTVDVTGKEIHLTQRQPTLKANIRAQKREQFTKASQEKPNESGLEFNHFDSRVTVPAPVRPKKNFRFVEQGTFQSLGQKLRTKARLEALQRQIGQVAKKTGISSAARLALLNSIEIKKEEKTDLVPDIEWWDVIVLKDESYEQSLNKLEAGEDELFEGITHLVEHPMQMRPPNESTTEVALPVFLTKKEQKKLRRQNRREAWKEKQEKIRLGLEPPPEPKVKMSNMMRVLGSQAVQDPTKIEAHVREQVARRQREHEEANAARKLTDEQKREKKTKKVQEDTSLGVHVSLYRVLSLMNPAKKFKVETNARQLTMTGIAVLFKNVNVVVVEGGPKQQKKFKQLMLNRIKWSEEHVTVDNDGSGTSEVLNSCQLVWQGITKNRSFGEFKIKISPNESFAKELFKNHNVPHYWDLAYSSAILESSDV